MRIFHIADPDTWARARPTGSFTMSTRGRTLEEEGFIHCSQPHQVALVLDAVYADLEHDLLLLVIDTDLLTSPWQLDDVPGADDPFPHIYGPLNASAVVDELVLRRTADGFDVPDLTGAPARPGLPYRPRAPRRLRPREARCPGEQRRHV